MIDKKPAAGRILVVESIFRNGYFNKGGIITKVSGKRVYYSGKYGDTFTLNVAAVCDTKDEESTLLTFERRTREELQSLVRSHEKQRDELFTKGD